MKFICKLIAVLLTGLALVSGDVFGDKFEGRPNASGCPCWEPEGYYGIGDALWMLNEEIVHTLLTEQIDQNYRSYQYTVFEETGNDCFLVRIDSQSSGYGGCLVEAGVSYPPNLCLHYSNYNEVWDNDRGITNDCFSAYSVFKDHVESLLE